MLQKSTAFSRHDKSRSIAKVLLLLYHTPDAMSRAFSSAAVLRLTAQCHINRDLRLQAESLGPQHFPEWLHLLVSLSAAACSPALIAAIPGASDIDNLETQHKSRFTHLHSTLLPQVTGRRNRRRLASPLHGTLTPGRISVGRPPFGRTGVSLSLTESSQNSLPQTAFGQMGTAGHLIFGRFDGSFLGTCPLWVLASTGGLGASSGVACLSRREAPSVTYLSLRLFNLQGALSYSISVTKCLLDWVQPYCNRSGGFF